MDAVGLSIDHAVTNRLSNGLFMPILPLLLVVLNHLIVITVVGVKLM